MAYDAVSERGLAMTSDEGVAFAVNDKQPDKPARAVKAARRIPHILRELENARLIADGLMSQHCAWVDRVDSKGRWSSWT